jgi:dsDNA-binding SOS-regulon protein
VDEDIFEDKKEVDAYDHEEMAHHISQIIQLVNQY